MTTIKCFCPITKSDCTTQCAMYDYSIGGCLVVKALCVVIGLEPKDNEPQPPYSGCSPAYARNIAGMFGLSCDERGVC